VGARGGRPSLDHAEPLAVCAVTIEPRDRPVSRFDDPQKTRVQRGAPAPRPHPGGPRLSYFKT
jgi:hypothetical protein